MLAKYSTHGWNLNKYLLYEQELNYCSRARFVSKLYTGKLYKFSKNNNYKSMNTLIVVSHESNILTYRGCIL